MAHVPARRRTAFFGSAGPEPAEASAVPSDAARPAGREIWPKEMPAAAGAGCFLAKLSSTLAGPVSVGPSSAAAPRALSPFLPKAAGREARSSCSAGCASAAGVGVGLGPGRPLTMYLRVDAPKQSSSPSAGRGGSGWSPRAEVEEASPAARQRRRAYWRDERVHCPRPCANRPRCRARGRGSGAVRGERSRVRKRRGQGRAGRKAEGGRAHRGNHVGRSRWRRAGARWTGARAGSRTHRHCGRAPRTAFSRPATRPAPVPLCAPPTAPTGGTWAGRAPCVGEARAATPSAKLSHRRDRRLPQPRPAKGRKIPPRHAVRTIWAP